MVSYDGGAESPLPTYCRHKTPTFLLPTDGLPWPKRVRYGWANVASGNLFNRAGRPASLFRSNE